MTSNFEYIVGQKMGINETHFRSEWVKKFETIMAQGNGYMGIRACTEEAYIGEKRGTFIAGNFNRFDDNEVTELVNCPDVTQLQMKVNGRYLSLERGQTSAYQRELNILNGLISRQFQWTEENLELGFRSERFVSLDDLHLFCHRVVIENRGQEPINLEFTSGIDGQISNSGSQHYSDGEKAYKDNTFLQMTSTTSQTKNQLVTTLSHRLVLMGQDEDYDTFIEMPRRKILKRYQLTLQPGASLKLDRYATYHTNVDKDWDQSQTLEEWALAHHTAAYSRDFDELFSQSASLWDKKVWQAIPISIQSSNELDELALFFARYHLQIMTPAHDARMNIGAKGLSGEGYKGHTFWDTELFMLPYFMYTQPKTARSLLEYRYLGLEGAHRKARDNGYDGAQYPWEAAWPTDGETTPVWGAADIITGKATKIWSGFIEQHITGDIAYAVQQYTDVTGDQDFMERFGREILLDTAKFWVSRLEHSPALDRYEICDVIGPDEYKEHVNNNAFTNYMAYWNMKRALDEIETLRQGDRATYQELNQSLNLDTLQSQLMDKLPKFYLPSTNEEGILPQDDTYLSKGLLDISAYKQAEEVGTLFKVYNLEQINQLQVSKQADVLLLIFLFENLFTKEEKSSNWQYYEPKTTHDSSLSLSTHSALAADLGDLDLAYHLFQKAIQIDLGQSMVSSDEGIHAASLGGIWQMTVFGFGGVRCLNGQLRIEPHLPEAWSMLQYQFYWKGGKVQVQVEPTKVKVTNLSDNQQLSFIHKGKQIEVEPRVSVKL